MLRRIYNGHSGLGLMVSVFLGIGADLARIGRVRVIISRDFQISKAVWFPVEG